MCTAATCTRNSRHHKHSQTAWLWNRRCCSLSASLAFNTCICLSVCHSDIIQNDIYRTITCSTVVLECYRRQAIPIKEGKIRPFVTSYSFDGSLPNLVWLSISATPYSAANYGWIGWTGNSRKQMKHNFSLIICPMRQQHWTDYKISLCVCQCESVSQWVIPWILGPPQYLVNG